MELFSADGGGCTPALLALLKYTKAFSSTEIHFSASEVKALPGQIVWADRCQRRRKGSSHPVLCEQTNVNRCTAWSWQEHAPASDSFLVMTAGRKWIRHKTTMVIAITLRWQSQRWGQGWERQRLIHPPRWELRGTGEALGRPPWTVAHLSLFHKHKRLGFHWIPHFLTCGLFSYELGQCCVPPSDCANAAEIGVELPGRSEQFLPPLPSLQSGAAAQGSLLPESLCSEGRVLARASCSCTFWKNKGRALHLDCMIPVQCAVAAWECWWCCARSRGLSPEAVLCYSRCGLQRAFRSSGCLLIACACMNTAVGRAKLNKCSVLVWLWLMLVL